MFGLLDDMEDPRAAGQMAMALGLLEAGGPSAQPVGLGQAFARAYGQGMQMQRGTQQMLDDRQLRGLKTKEAELTLRKMELDQAKQKRLQDAYKSFYAQRSGQPATSVAPDTAPVGLLDTENTAFPRQAMPDWMPARAPAQQQLAVNQPIMGADNYQRYLQFAQHLESQGFGEEAQKYFDLAEKFKPKLKEQKVLMRNGKPVTVNVFEDGRTESLDGFDPTPKISHYDIGGKIVFRDDYTNKDVGGDLTKTLTPGERASNGLGWANFGLSKERIAMERDNANRLQHVNVDNQPMTFNPRTGQYQAGIGPDGKPLPQTAKPLTEAQAKDNLFGTRMQEAHKLLTGLESKGVTRPGGIKTIAEGAGRVLGLGTESFGGTLSDVMGSATNWTQSSAQQSVEQAQRDFINAVLRKESGAAIAQGEFDNAKKQYFPQLGDTAQQIEQKRRNREIAIQGVLSGIPGGSRVKLPANNSGLPSGWSVTER